MKFESGTSKNFATAVSFVQIHQLLWWAIGSWSKSNNKANDPARKDINPKRRTYSGKGKNLRPSKNGKYLADIRLEREFEDGKYIRKWDEGRTFEVTGDARRDTNLEVVYLEGNLEQRIIAWDRFWLFLEYEIHLSCDEIYLEI